jgi:hypothetical protein
LLSTLIGRVVRVLDAAFEDQGPGELADAKVADGLDTRPDATVLGAMDSICTSSRVAVVACNEVYTPFL